MVYWNSLLLLRIFAVICTILFARELIGLFNLVEQSPIPKLGSFGSRNDKSLRWDEVDIFVPPALDNIIYEGLRLNELLARSQIKCNNIVRVGGDSGYSVCNNSKYLGDGMNLGEALVISGSAYSDGTFVAELNPRRWTMFIVQDFKALDSLGNVDVELHYLLHLSEDGDWRFDEIITEIEGRDFDVALVNLYCPYLNGRKQFAADSIPDMLLRLLEVLNTRQLQLLVNINRKSSNETVLEWYRAMYRIFFDYHYALFAAESSGTCGREFERCKYRLSFLRYSDEHVEPPVFGLGTPLEERKRLCLYLLSKNHETCNTTDFEKTGIFLCKDVLQNTTKCSIVVVRYRYLEVADHFEDSDTCETVLVSPILRNRDNFNGRFLNAGISLTVNSTMNVPGTSGAEKWSLIPFAQILEMVSEELIDGVFLDLDGGEWDVFEAILSTTELKRVHYFGMRIRLWIGEENENFRLFLAYFFRLEKIGFQKVSVKIEDESAFEVLYRRL